MPELRRPPLLSLRPHEPHHRPHRHRLRLPLASSSSSFSKRQRSLRDPVRGGGRVIEREDLVGACATIEATYSWLQTCKDLTALISMNEDDAGSKGERKSNLSSTYRIFASGGSRGCGSHLVRAHTKECTVSFMDMMYSFSFFLFSVIYHPPESVQNRDSEDSLDEYSRCCTAPREHIVSSAILFIC